MMPRLQAEESLLVSTRLAVGAGHMKTSDREEVLEEWAAKAEGRERVKPSAVNGPVFPRFQG
jgi:hypothetical protein